VGDEGPHAADGAEIGAEAAAQAMTRRRYHQASNLTKTGEFPPDNCSHG
jgi:hypothetical protein